MRRATNDSAGLVHRDDHPNHLIEVPAKTLTSLPGEVGAKCPGAEAGLYGQGSTVLPPPTTVTFWSPGPPWQ